MKHHPATWADHRPGDPSTPCPCACGRMVLPGNLIHVAGVPHQVFQGAAYVCDGCWETSRLVGRVSAAALVHYTGGTPDAVSTARVFDAKERGAGTQPPPHAGMVRSPQSPADRA